MGRAPASWLQRPPLSLRVRAVAASWWAVADGVHSRPLLHLVQRLLILLVERIAVDPELSAGPNGSCCVPQDMQLVLPMYSFLSHPGAAVPWQGILCQSSALQAGSLLVLAQSEEGAEVRSGCFISSSGG